MKRLTSKIVLVALMATLTLSGCKKDEPAITPPPDPNPGTTIPEASITTQKINQFIKTAMSDVYLWADQLPTIDTKYETDSKAYFKKLLYKEDKWSWITDDVVALENSFEGIEKAFGYSLAFGSFTDASGAASGNYFAIVEYVYPNTPAHRAGFTRGNIITKLNGASITKNNYKDLLDGANISVTKGILTNKGIADTEIVSMTSEELNLDPVIMYKTIEKSGHKVGYLFYAQYIGKYNKSLQKAFDYFKETQITDLVVDLRYNPGGGIDAAKYFCSSIVPLDVVNNSRTLVTFQWNNKYQQYWNSKGKTEELSIPFDKTVPTKLGMSKVTFLIGSGSASASELSITGLRPYMGVTLVGDTTYGKYTASITLKPKDYYEKETEYTNFKNWALQPIVIRYANSQGVTDFKNGFAPDFKVRDELLPAQPLGEISEPLLKKAIENITGEQIVAMKSAPIKYDFKIFDRGFSKFDQAKRNTPTNLKPNILKQQNPGIQDFIK